VLKTCHWKLVNHVGTCSCIANLIIFPIYLLLLLLFIEYKCISYWIKSCKVHNNINELKTWKLLMDIENVEGW